MSCTIDFPCSPILKFEDQLEVNVKVNDFNVREESIEEVINNARLFTFKFDNFKFEDLTVGVTTSGDVFDREVDIHVVVMTAGLYGGHFSRGVDALALMSYLLDALEVYIPQPDSTVVSGSFINSTPVQGCNWGESDVLVTGQVDTEGKLRHEIRYTIGGVGQLRVNSVGVYDWRSDIGHQWTAHGSTWLPSQDPLDLTFCCPYTDEDPEDQATLELDQYHETYVEGLFLEPQELEVEVIGWEEEDDGIIEVDDQGNEIIII